MEIWKIILLLALVLLLINKITFNIRFDYTGFSNENMSDLKDFKIIIYWWSFKRKCRMHKIL